MSFKENILSDLDNIFFNLNEFAELCTFNKNTIKAIIDDQQLIAKYSSEFEALGQGGHLVYAVESQFKTLPRNDEAIEFNKNLYVIDEVKREYGMLLIFLRIGRV